LGIAALVVFLLSRSLSRPVARLTIAASEIGRGNFNTKIDISSKDELGVLARELDQMKDSLKSSKEKIEGYSHSLEETVRERTAELNKKMAELEKYNEVMLSVLDDTDEAKRKLQETLDELKTTSDKLIQAGKLSGIGQMAAGIAHEINNPLTSILGYAQLMMSNAGLDPQIREDLTRIERESKRCVTIIENLLAFARPTPSQKEPLSVNDIVDNTLKVIEYSITREKINIIKEMDTGLPMVMADPYQLQQVFMNLVINAVRAMPDGGDLTISTKVRSSKSTSNLGTSNSEPADLVEISFADTGHGIADNVKEKIFEPFFSTSYQRGQKGSGLGLSISHSIVAEHGGRLEFESAEGKGTTFKVLLPVA
jgi:two-component system NtrC family sensor kinase